MEMGYRSFGKLRSKMMLLRGGEPSPKSWFPELDARGRGLGISQLSGCSHYDGATIFLNTTALRNQFLVFGFGFIVLTIFLIGALL
ncbi:hypothetical protein D3C87_299990 [compost metagenome]